MTPRNRVWLAPFLLLFAFFLPTPALAQDAPPPPAKTAAADQKAPAKKGEEKKPAPPAPIPEWAKPLPEWSHTPIAEGIRFVTTTGVTFAINLVAALLIFVVGRIAAGLLTRLVRRLMTKAKLEETLISFVCNLVYMLLLAFVVVASLEKLGVNTTSFAAIIAAAGLAVGFALQGSLSNFASGVMLIIFKPFKVGDVIEAGGTKGKVIEIQIFSTVMQTPDNVRIVVPNSAITGGNITNFSAMSTRRIDMSFGCAYGDDLKAVKAYLEEVLAGHEKVLADPAPAVFVSGLGDSSVDFAVRPWVNSADYWGVMAELTEAIKLGFDEKGFNFPYPTRDLNITSQVAPAAS
ncbi:MAG TPA: mechanosensitive ion channel protein MscS [Planctomycetes bacterium]|nr:mechanosensitive ion channel protein MscS [Planctomycetota bacterium]